MFLEAHSMKESISNSLSKRNTDRKWEEYRTIWTFYSISIVIVSFCILSDIIENKHIRRCYLMEKSNIRDIVRLMYGADHIIVCV
jgi:hypothetical protein